MYYAEDLFLGELRPAISKLLKTGEVLRYGGVLRIAKGLPGAGQIVAHLRDVGVASSAITPALGPILGLTQVAAAASVVGLGVSIVGFAVMNHKLEKLKASVADLAAKSAQNHTEVLASLDLIGEQLVELRYIALESHELLAATLDEVRRVRSDLLDTYLASVLTEIDLLRRATVVDDARTVQALRVLGTARRWLQSSIAAFPARAKDDVHWYDRMTRFRLLCLTWTAEAHLLRRVGDDTAAAQLLREAARASRAWASDWSRALLPPKEYGGAFRFAHSAFDAMPREVMARIVRLQDGTELAGTDEREVEAGMAIARDLPNLTPGWASKQRAVAGLLDFAEEATARLESLADELEMCAELRMGYADWEAMPSARSGGGLLLLRKAG